jgi:hypothetical protein
LLAVDRAELLLLVMVEAVEAVRVDYFITERKRLKHQTEVLCQFLVALLTQ